MWKTQEKINKNVKKYTEIKHKMFTTCDNFFYSKYNYPVMQLGISKRISKKVFKGECIYYEKAD